MNVYIIEANGIFKVGLANDVQKRKRALQTSNPYTLKIRHFVKMENRKQAKAVEKMMHIKFKSKRKRGEWFTAELEELKNGLAEVSGIYEAAKTNPTELLQIPEKLRQYRGQKKRISVLQRIKKSTAATVTLDKHNLPCLLTGGCGLPRSIIEFLEISSITKGWKKSLYGRKVSRLDFLRHCDTNLVIDCG